ncbi:Uma2 family endonuclease [Myxacorys almedinensis]|uniref:Uma2 family endonuclease n=1 Tax=Myxacorys almedinensis A TaxID=2690445 RepID=A0A8J8CNF7_9CYAN|nr:Uma2 family endonuclease [Myxacorys almedinensis]NDJ18377.1 Uma2 family endonuclease [Myxacorys almedinensis A]
MSNQLSTSVPRLESGDRLTRHEFERRYAQTPEDFKAELIEGVVYVASPVRVKNHGRPHAQVMVWLGTYYAATPGVDFADNSTVRLDLDNEPQPDALLRIEPEVGGRSRVTDDDYIEGSPELVVEIAASSAAVDMNAKLNAYRRNGVQEYLVWQTYENRLDWFYLQEGEYMPFQADAQGIIQSRVFPGLWLAVDALLRGDLAIVLAELQKGLATPEHRSFMKRLEPH